MTDIAHFLIGLGIIIFSVLAYLAVGVYFARFVNKKAKATSTKEVEALVGMVIMWPMFVVLVGYMGIKQVLIDLVTRE